MSAEKQPRAAFTVQVTEQDYVAAAKALRFAGGRRAREQFQTYTRLFPTAQVSLWDDFLTVEGEGFSRSDPYALLLRLLETRTLFLMLREDGSFLILPKHDLPLDGGRVPSFLRETFARKYKRG